MKTRASQNIREDFASKIIDWFRENSRDFSWRRTDNPYHILVAEILLQRTKAKQVEPIYEEFISKFPTPSVLATTGVEQIQSTIEPLGLRKRAGMMKQLAEEIVEKHNGEIPKSADDLLGLMGVGKYVANAILCFAYGKDVPIVDWNVARVFQRFAGYPLKSAPHADKDFISFVSGFVPEGRARNFNLALLDFSASVCTPRKMACDSCPVKGLCANRYKTLDLFAGIGGIRKGFELTGRFENVLSAEIDKYACETYKHLFGDDPYNDATSEDFKARVAATDYDVLIAGFPCQAFSIAGRKEGFKDKTRGSLFFDIADILDRTRPKAFLLENVEGLLRHKKGQTFRVILETLVVDLQYKLIGVEKSLIREYPIYNPSDFLLNSRYFGVPQNRPRIYLMGFDSRKYGDLLDELPTRILPKKRSGRPIYGDLNKLLEYGAESAYYLSEGYLRTLKRHRERHEAKGHGFGYIVVNATNIKKPVSNAILAIGGSGKERNLVWDPQKNVAGMYASGKKTPLNGEGIRVMTPREWGKLQGFVGYAFIKNGRDGFSFPEGVSKAQQYIQFGNSVTIPVIEVLAEEMAKCLDHLEGKLNIRKKADQLHASHSLVGAID